ncbi:MAG: hypothetical protein K2P04_05700, partial [Oscillospiraceae bacterium]|nr:hypothetical protein [Oscillospiraceae bacterium]
SVRPGHAGPGQPGSPGRSPAAGLISQKLRLPQYFLGPGLLPGPFLFNGSVSQLLRSFQGPVMTGLLFLLAQKRRRLA